MAPDAEARHSTPRGGRGAAWRGLHVKHWYTVHANLPNSRSRLLSPPTHPPFLQTPTHAPQHARAQPPHSFCSSTGTDTAAAAHTKWHTSGP